MKKSLSSVSLLFALALMFSFTLSSSTHQPDSQGFITCLQSNPNINETFISQLTFTPSNSSFLRIWQFSAMNLRFDKPSTRKPSIIITPTHETQIQTALFCTKKHGYKIRIRSGGHDFEGLSYTADAPFVMIDLYNMRKIDIDVGNKTAWVQPGATLGELYYEISERTDTLFFPGGVCPTVGVGGFISGGGYGNLLRKYGLGADNVVDVRFMDVKGNILDRNSMGEDLFWAIRGGGASSFGIVLAWKVKLVTVPEKVTVFSVSKTLEENATAIFHRYQYVAPTLDRNLHIRVAIARQNITIRMTFEGIYQGAIDSLLPLMEEYFPELNVTRDICEEVKMVQSVLVFQGLASSTPSVILTNRTAFAKSSNKGKSDYVRRPIPVIGLEKMWKKMLENDGSELVVINPFGGKMSDYSETAIPYPHRGGVLYQILEWVDLTDQHSDTTVTSRRRLSWLHEFNKFLAPYVSKYPREAYSNYVDLDLGVGKGTYEEASVWGERYWKRNNFKKLIRIKAKVDPDNFFRHPQSIPVFSK